ncbi:MAG TPA: MFS transporter [Gemmatimonadaceae bacterium]|nr:MFS transporter [Gemmatimonadaceae bacterium]
MAQLEIAQTLQSPVVRVLGGAIAAGLLFILAQEVRKIPPKLFALMATAFIDMIGLLMIIPIIPFYARELATDGLQLGPVHLGIGMIQAILVTSFTIAQLLSAPMWGRFSDKHGRRPALLIALGASALAYLVFGFATSLFVLFLSRILQGAGGGTVGVIQAYVADAVEPQDRARSLGWLSAATNLGVALGPVLGSAAISLGKADLAPGDATWSLGRAAPGIVAALLCVINMWFVQRYLQESREHHPHAERKTSREAVWRVLSHSGEAPSRLIWIYAIAMGSFQGVTAMLPLFLAARFAVDEGSIGYFFMYVGAISVFTRVLLLGRAVDRLGEARLSRWGVTLLALGIAGMPLSANLGMLAVAVALVPLGTAFTFPCVTALLSRVISPAERGLYMGLQQTFGGVARIAVPLWAGFAFDRLGVGIPFYTSAIAVFLTIFLGLGLDQYAKPKAAAAA